MGEDGLDVGTEGGGEPVRGIHMGLVDRGRGERWSEQGRGGRGANQD